MAQPIPKVPPPPPRAGGSGPKPPPPRATGTTPKPAAGASGARQPPTPTQQDVAPARYQAGDVIAGKYRLVSLLGEGGMGSVWRVRNMDLDVEVALKLIRAEATLSEATDRLLREAQAAAKLTDSGIVRVFDFGRSEQGNPFIVMELLEGEDLAAAIQRRGRLSPKRAVRVLLPVVRALAVAHQNGIVHRDLKPENVFLSKTPNGLQPKVVDFGIAQLDKSQALRLTSTGALMGSPLYMSPEQAKGEAVDFRADIWGITAVLYEALSGMQPFPGGNYNAVLCAIMLREPERPAAEVGVDDELWSLVQRGLAKEPAFRYESMRHFGQALAKWLVECGEQTDITGASLVTQWLEHDQPADQLTTVFPPTGEVRIERRSERDERNAPTQRLSRDPGLAAAASQRSRQRPRRRMLVAAAAAGGLIGALAVAWAAFGTRAPEPASSVEPAGASARTAPLPAKAAQIRASEAAEPPPPSEPAPPDVAEPAPAEAPEPEATPPASEPAEKRTTAARQPRVRPTTASRPASAGRTSKLKNPFAQ